MNNKTKILEKLKRASYAYYNELESKLTDEEYDSLSSFAEEQGWLNQDESLNDNSEIILTNKVIHSTPMLSLAKAKTEEEILSFFNKAISAGAKTFFVEPKLDGLALSVELDNNKKVKTISSRGNGIEGEDLTYLLNNKELYIKNLFDNYSSLSNIDEIRGELVCSHEDLLFNNKSRKENFKNERNAVSGIVKKAKLGLGYKAKLHFVPYFGVSNNNLILLPDSVKEQSKFLFKENKASTFKELVKIIKEANLWRQSIEFPTDGIVIKPLERIAMGNTNHHPREYIAYKYPAEKKVTTVTNISFSIGKTGKVTPTIEAEPVELSGATVSNYTGNNYEWIKNKNISIGSKILVTRTNDVIPFIVSTVDNTNARKLEIPEFCPHCNSKLQGPSLKLLKCPNKKCPSRVIYQMEYITHKNILNIDGLSTEILRSLPQVRDVNDMIELTYEDLKNLKYSNSGVSLGNIRAKQIYDEIVKAKTQTEDYKWLSALNIPNIANNTSKLILSKITLEELFEDLNKSKKVLKELNGIGPEILNTFEEYFNDSKEIVNKLKNNGVVFNRKEVSTTEQKGIIVHTGSVPEGFSNRGEFKDYLETVGFKMGSGVNKKTDYLITEEKDSSSSKSKKARELNIPIVNWEEFKNLNNL